MRTDLLRTLTLTWLGLALAPAASAEPDAAHVTLHQSTTFGGALIQSPAFKYDDQVHGDRLRRSFECEPKRPVRLFIDAGTLHDDLARGRAFRDLLRRKGYALRYVEVNEGHSWGHWRAWIDNALGYLLAAR